MRAPIAMKLFVPLLLLASQAAPAAAQGKALKWGPAPAVFPAGARMAVVDGDPGKAEMFTVRLEMPNRYHIPMHSHPADEQVTVLKGALLVQPGDTTKAHRMTLRLGKVMMVKANETHAVTARGRTIVQVHGMGPFALNYVNPADDPTKKKAEQ